jgi:hypothetical protein
MPPAAKNNRALPPKESQLFKELLNLYETRQLKKALKTADTVLKKFPEHGGRVHAPPAPPPGSSHFAPITQRPSR